MIRNREGFIRGWKRNLSMLTLEEVKGLKQICEQDIKERENDEM